MSSLIIARHSWLALTLPASYLQNGNCGQSGENCSLMELTLINGGVSSADISLIPPHSFSQTIGFG